MYRADMALTDTVRFSWSWRRRLFLRSSNSLRFSSRGATHRWFHSIIEMKKPIGHSVLTGAQLNQVTMVQCF